MLGRLTRLIQRILGGGARNQHKRDRPFADRWDTAELARRLGVSESELRSTPPKYHLFRIPKRRGGSRTILAPVLPLKRLQRRIHRRLLASLKAHPAVCGFERGRSIVDNAHPHVGRRVVIRLDVRDFFASTSAPGSSASSGRSAGRPSRRRC